MAFTEEIRRRKKDKAHKPNRKPKRTKYEYIYIYIYKRKNWKPFWIWGWFFSACVHALRAHINTSTLQLCLCKIVFALILPQLPYAKLSTFCHYYYLSIRCWPSSLALLLLLLLLVGCSSNRAIAKSPNRKMWWLFFGARARTRSS